MVRKITLRRDDLTKIERMLVRHRFLGKFGWHYMRVGNVQTGHPIFQSAAASACEVINLEVEEAFKTARSLSRGERVWADAVKLVVAGLNPQATLESQRQALQSVCRARAVYRPKNCSLSRRLAIVGLARLQIDALLESGDRTGASQLVRQSLRLVASLLRHRKFLVLLPPGTKPESSRDGKPSDFSVEDIDRAVRTWACYPGFSGETCSECYARANVLSGGPGWFCECGQYNNQCFHGGMRPHANPDYGPSAATIGRGTHLSCDATCSYCVSRGKVTRAS
jgi:hypothetical protein